MDIDDLRIFVRVAALQSLSAVGNELGLTAGTISKRLQALEQELSARLFDRTTRSVRITPEGGLFLEHAERILDHLEQARSQIEMSAGRACGKLRIAAPTHLGARLVGPAISAFLAAYPDIEVQLDLLDRPINIHEEGYDVVIHSGALADSALIAKRLAPDPRVMVAAPAYLAKAGVPRAARDLERHQCLALAGERQWSLLHAGTETVVAVQGRLAANNGELLKSAALDGHGILLAPLASVEAELAEGRLVRVLADHEVGGEGAIHALYSSARHQPPRLRALLDFLAEWMRKDAWLGPVATTAATGGGEGAATLRPVDADQTVSHRLRRRAGGRG
ncbi:MAG: LysR family transcriptional regulator [Pseudomonadota bacterium]